MQINILTKKRKNDDEGTMNDNEGTMNDNVNDNENANDDGNSTLYTLH